MELVFCSLDRVEDQWKDYTANMPWLCMPFGATESQKMARTYKADGIPHLVVVDVKSGQVVTSDGTEEVGEDPKGLKFPWRPKSFSEIWPSQILASKSSSQKMLDTSTLKDKHLMLYFSAHWCPPCRKFTPILSKAYTKLRAERDDFELVFVSSDRDEQAFKEYFNEMTFCALPYEHREAKTVLSKKYEVAGIPKLIMLGPVSDEQTMDRPLINSNIRGAIEAGDFSDFPFPERNYGDLEGSGNLNECKCIIVFHEGGDDDEQEDIKNILKEVGKKKEDEENVQFLWAFSTGGLAPRVRSALGMPEHPTEDHPVMVLLDIPDNGGYYKSDVTDITIETVTKFLESPGKRQQLQ